jgi:hypothetical protein
MEYSPILSVLTALFEVAAAIWALRGPGRRPIVYSTSAILVLLAVYQSLEVIICTAPQGYGFLPQMAFITITWLPPAGLLLVAELYTSKKRGLYWSVRLLFGLALLLVSWILLDRSFVSESVCTIVFARYANPMTKYLIYCGFYWLGLGSMVTWSAYGMKRCGDPNQSRLLGQVLLGSIAFIVPSLITAAIIPSTKGALPSIMCHYALLLAIFLTRLLYLERRHTQ